MKIAIIGTGISGNIAAYLLVREHEIVVYEKNSYVGGHSRTLEVDYDGQKIAVDTGFIVFNYRNYPLLTAMFKHLDVAVEKSDMSFAATINAGWLEYNAQSPLKLFAQKRNIFRPKYWLMIRDILKFFKAAKSILQTGDKTKTLGEFVAELKLGKWFQEYFLLPMGGAIWSCPPKQMLDFPAHTFVRFFDNHGLLSVNDQPQWYTVSGGSKNYVEKLTSSFADKIRLNCAAKNVSRAGGKVQITDEHEQTEVFDHVIFASHADETLAMLDDASDDERKILGAFQYQANTAYLHRDAALMPKNRNCWASWVYLSEQKNDKSAQIGLTYWMNLLQNIDNKYPLFVTLNPAIPPKKELVFNQHIFHHPVFTVEAIAAQEQLEKIQGQRNTWFCGAYQRYGFHEDGMQSGVNVAQKLGAKLPW